MNTSDTNVYAAGIIGNTRPWRLARAGLTDIARQPRFLVVGNDGSADEAWQRTVAQFAPASIKQVVLTEHDLNDAAKLLRDRAFVDVPMAFVSVWGRRAATP